MGLTDTDTFKVSMATSGLMDTAARGKLGSECSLKIRLGPALLGWW